MRRGQSLASFSVAGTWGTTLEEMNREIQQAIGYEPVTVKKIYAPTSRFLKYADKILLKVNVL
ncbi:hypothetical protein [Roseofilum casamattae]|uniref:Uncharacterized protein n=1 Tax=Roseofilum casamattae BLCC-M143 TaxID=3022442 RepID=A0ABT7BSU1_9CYAN|nr:hypothetical protein [Roseofilum casamattae]MDJ1182248.1 hypothetical protein [Roseofilum casamattae BLCC-M143]